MSDLRTGSMGKEASVFHCAPGESWSAIPLFRLPTAIIRPVEHLSTRRFIAWWDVSSIRYWEAVCENSQCTWRQAAMTCCTSGALEAYISSTEGQSLVKDNTLLKCDMMCAALQKPGAGAGKPGAHILQRQCASHATCIRIRLGAEKATVVCDVSQHVTC